MIRRPLVSVLLVATGPERVVAAALELCARQTAATDMEVVAVCARGREAVVRRRLEALPSRHPSHVLPAPTGTPGGLRNAALRRSAGELVVVLDGGDLVPPDYLRLAIAALREAPAAGFATAPGEYTPTAEASTVDLPLLLASPWALAPAVIRRSALERGGGFDESLPDLADWDLLLTLAESGETGLLLTARVPRSREDDVRLREALRAERHLPSVRHLFAKHERSFRSHAGAALVHRDRLAGRLWAEERKMLERRARLQQELIAVMHELAAAQAELQADGRSTLEWSDLRRTSPLSRNWGLERGTPVDRHYIDAFVAGHATDIRGTVLEMLDPGLAAYAAGRVERADVLDIDPANDRATIVADLRAADVIPSETYDCFILTQTLHLIDDMPAALAHAHRILKPGGVLLATLPCVSMVAREYGAAGDHWRVTPDGARRLFERFFAPADLTIEARGNVLASTAFLYGLARHELQPQELEADDPAYPLIVTVRAVKSVRNDRHPRPDASLSARDPRLPGRPAPRAAVLLYHRIADGTRDRYGLCVRPGEFREQLEYLCREWHPMPLAALTEAAFAGDVPDRAVALTFDDGYVDNLEAAAPLLGEFGVPATFFVTTEPLMRPCRFWWDMLEAIFGGPMPESISVELDGRLRSFSTAGDDARTAAHDELYAILRQSLPAARDDLLRQLARASGAIRPASLPRPFTADELRRLASLPGCEIGAHGVHHVALADLDAEHVFRETSECRSTLERIVRRPVVLFAYPHGIASPEAVSTTRAAGYRYAFTSDERLLGRAEHPHRLPRIQTPPAATALRALLERRT